MAVLWLALFMYDNTYLVPKRTVSLHVDKGFSHSLKPTTSSQEWVNLHFPYLGSTASLRCNSLKTSETSQRRHVAMASKATRYGNLSKQPKIKEQNFTLEVYERLIF